MDSKMLVELTQLKERPPSLKIEWVKQDQQIFNNPLTRLGMIIAFASMHSIPLY